MRSQTSSDGSYLSDFRASVDGLGADQLLVQLMSRFLKCLSLFLISGIRNFQEGNIYEGLAFDLQVDMLRVRSGMEDIIESKQNDPRWS